MDNLKINIAYGAREPVVAPSPDSGTTTPLRCDGKRPPPNCFPKSTNRLVGIHLTILIYEPPVVFC
jgi:hypothetical protein